MPRPFQMPVYQRHQVGSHAYARCKLFGKYVSLGAFNSPESLQRFEEVVAQFRAGKPRKATGTALTVLGLTGAWLDHVAEVGLYRRADGSPTSEIASWRLSVAPLLRLFESEPASEFTPKKLKTVRDAMCSGSWLREDEKATRKLCEIQWCRRTVNMRVKRLVRLFGWAVSEELVPVTVHQALLAVASLQAGSKAQDYAERGPVYRQDIRATLACLADVPRAIALVQLATGMRPSEACAMRVEDIDRRGDIWVYRPGQHKTRRHGIAKAVPLGPAAQWVIAPRLGGEWVFPAPKIAGSYVLRHYLDCVRTAAVRAGVLPWSPGRLRKNVATDLQERFGIETARAMLGHQGIEVTRRAYAKGDLTIASRAAAKAG